MAQTLEQLGSERAWLVHGSDGTDELTITGVSSVAMLDTDGSVAEAEIHPDDFGLPVHPFETILGGSPAHNAAAFRALLNGAHSAYRDAVLLNAAAALIVDGRLEDLAIDPITDAPIPGAIYRAVAYLWELQLVVF